MALNFSGVFTILLLLPTLRPCGFITDYLSNLLSGLFLSLDDSASLSHLPLGGEEPLEKEVATLSNILAWEIPWTEGDWQVTVHEVANGLDMTS